MSNRQRNTDSGRRDSLGRRIMVADHAGSAGRSDAPAPSETSAAADALIEQIGDLDTQIEQHVRVHIAIDDYATVADYRQTLQAHAAQGRALRQQRDTLRADAAKDPDIAAEWHRHNQAAVDRLRNELRSTGPTSGSSIEQIVAYAELAKQFDITVGYTDESRRAYQTSLGIDPYDFHGRAEHKWALQPEDLQPDVEARSYQRAAAYAQAALSTRDPNRRRTFDAAAQRCSAGDYGTGINEPCIRCAKPQTRHEYDEYECARC